MPFMRMEHQSDPKQDLLDKLGDLEGLEVLHNQIVCAIYIRPDVTAGGIYLTDKYREEDKYQGKVGLVVKMGPDACKPDGQWYQDVQINLHDWLAFRPSDGWPITINDVPCRVLEDPHVRMRISHPDMVW